MVVTGKGRSKESNPGLPLLTGTQLLEPSLLPPRVHISMKLESEAGTEDETRCFKVGCGYPGNQSTRPNDLLYFECN